MGSCGDMGIDHSYFIRNLASGYLYYLDGCSALMSTEEEGKGFGDDKGRSGFGGCCSWGFGRGDQCLQWEGVEESNGEESRGHVWDRGRQEKGRADQTRHAVAGFGEAWLGDCLWLIWVGGFSLVAVSIIRRANFEATIILHFEYKVPKIQSL